MALHNMQQMPARGYRTHVSVERAVAILNALSSHRDAAGLTELAVAAGCHKSTALRLLQTLERHSYVERLADTGRYRLGLKVLTLAYATLARITVQREAEPVVRKLVALTNETVSVAMLDGVEIVYINRLKAQPSASLNTPVGARAPAHCTALGKIMLADRSPDEIRRLLGPGPFPAFTPRTITSLDSLLIQLARVRETQYAVNDEEHRPGQVCFATPIRDHTGMVIAGISITAPSYSLTDNRREFLIKCLCAGAEEVSSAMGYEPSRLVVPASR